MTTQDTSTREVASKPLSVLRNNKRVTVDIPEETLAKMIIYNSRDKATTVLDISKQCRVMLLTLRHMRCCLCKYAMVRMAELYKTLLQCNTIPVLIHYETAEDATEYIERCPSYLSHPNKDVIFNLFRVADPTGSYFYQQLKIEENSSRFLFDLAMSLGKAKTLEARTGISNPKNIVRKHWTRYPAFFIIENGKVTNAFYSPTFGGTIDYTKLLVDPERESCSGEVCPAMLNPEELNQMFGVYVDSLTTHKGKDHDVFATIVGQFLCTAEVDIDAQDLIPLDAASVDLKSVLSDTYRRRFFKLYAIKEMSVENILCYEEIMEFKQKDDTSTNEMVKEAMGIYKKYVEAGSLLEVNLGAEMKKEVSKRLQSSDYDRDVFDPIVVYLKANNLSDMFSRFSRHTIFNDMLEYKKRKKQTKQ